MIQIGVVSTDWRRSARRNRLPRLDFSAMRRIHALGDHHLETPLQLAVTRLLEGGERGIAVEVHLALQGHAPTFGPGLAVQRPAAEQVLLERDPAIARCGAVPGRGLHVEMHAGRRCDGTDIVASRGEERGTRDELKREPDLRAFSYDPAVRGACSKRPRYPPLAPSRISITAGSSTPSTISARPIPRHRINRKAPARFFLSRRIRASSAPAAMLAGSATGKPKRCSSASNRWASSSSAAPRQVERRAASTMPIATASPCSSVP